MRKRNGRYKPWGSTQKAAELRSRLEDSVVKWLKRAGAKFEYEPHALDYTVPETYHKYTPDILLENGIYVEAKGYFPIEDRKKMLLVIAQHPDKDIRMLFQAPNNKIRKGAKTTYADWCEKNNIKWCAEHVPKSWIDEKLK
jgi:hypothetical protein